MNPNNEIKIGDVVICIRVGSLPNQEAVPPPLKLKAEYIVQGIKICACGRKMFDVGIAAIFEISVCTCGVEFHNESIYWCASERFVKRDTRSIAERITEAIETENYELAKELTEKNIK